MLAYMVKRTWENGEIEWGMAYIKNKGKGKWTRHWDNASIWLSKQGPIQFMRYIRETAKKDKMIDNCLVELVTFRLEEVNCENRN
jgi:hypothetical protein